MLILKIMYSRKYITLTYSLLWVFSVNSNLEQNESHRVVAFCFDKVFQCKNIAMWTKCWIYSLLHCRDNRPVRLLILKIMWHFLVTYLFVLYLSSFTTFSMFNFLYLRNPPDGTKLWFSYLQTHSIGIKTITNKWLENLTYFCDRVKELA